MDVMDVKIIDAGNSMKALQITIPISPRGSKTGKSTIVAGTGGFIPTAAIWEGKPIAVSVNACIK